MNRLRRPEYISPTALFLFESKPDDYFMNYLAPIKVPRFPQTQPMSVGSAFDAYVKSYLHDAIYGKNHRDAPKYELKSLFDAQVEAHNRDWAWENGKYVYEMYKQSGALADLMTELAKAADDPRFEFDLKGEVKGYREGVTKYTHGVTLMGKPDLRFITSEGLHVIHDWKVNGYCGNSNTSPKPGYIECREFVGAGWVKRGQHKSVFPQIHKGMMIDNGAKFESNNEEWAVQLSTYLWLLGDPVGSDMIAAVDQIVANCPKRLVLEPYTDKPYLRVAHHRARVSDGFQFSVLNRYQYLWSILSDINTDKFYFFRELSFEDSKLKCEALCRQAEALTNPNLPDDAKRMMQWSRE